MAITPKRLYGPAMISSASIAYTVPLATTAIVKQVMACNTSTVSPASFRIGVLGSSNSTLNESDCFVFDAPISAKETILLNTSLVLTASEKLVVFSSSGGASVSVTFNGIEEI